MEQNVLITKMIGIVVAVIVAAVVLVPICNSLTEGDGGNGEGSGEEGGTTDYVVLNDLETMYGKLDISVPFKTLQSYALNDQSSNYNRSKNISESDITLDMDYIEKISDAGNTGSTNMSQNISLLSVYVYYEDNSGFGFGIYIHYTDNSTYSNKLMFSSEEYAENGDATVKRGFVEDISAFSLTVKNGVITLSVDGYTTKNNISDYIEIRKSVEIEETIAASLEYASDDEIGWVGGEIHATYIDESEQPFPNLMVGSVFQTGELSINYDLSGVEGFADTYPLIKVENIQNNALKGTVNVNAIDEEGFTIQDEYFIVEYEIPLIELSDGVYTFADKGDSATWTIVGNVGLDGAENISLDQYDIWGENGYASSINANPVEISESGNGSSSGGNDLGVAGTIIGIIPVFVVLAILMGAVGLFYQNRKAI